MSQSETLTGAEWLARTLAANGTTHVFFIDAVLRRTLIELGTLGVTAGARRMRRRPAAYMADGYARVAGRPGVCFAQSVGAANLAAGLQDAWLGRSAGDRADRPQGSRRTSTAMRIRRCRTRRCSRAVTKFAAAVDSAADLPRLLRQAWRAAMTGTPRPAHLDFNGLQGEIIETGHDRRTARRRSGAAAAHAAAPADAVG